MDETNTEIGAELPAKKVFPPFDPTTFAPTLFWLAITFTILYVMLERSLLPRIKTVIGERAAKITGDLNAADQMRRDADAALQAYERAIAEARARAVQISGEARLAIKAETDKQRAAVDAELALQVEAAERRIAEAKTRALSGLRSVAIEVAGAIVEKVLNERASIAELGRAVDEELAA